MAHWVKIENGVVVNGLVCDTKEWLVANLGGEWVQTSYNTRGGIHYGEDGQPDGGVALHKNYAGIGYTFDGTGFASPKPYESWSLDLFSYLWQAPVAMPTDGKMYNWDETTQAWVEVPSL